MLMGKCRFFKGKWQAYDIKFHFTLYTFLRNAKYQVCRTLRSFLYLTDHSTMNTYGGMAVCLHS